MRIIAGKFKGRPLRAPSSHAIRPTSDRLRETLFNILTHRFDDSVTGARVLDLFAGTGALGLEAVSRGASFCLFIDEGIEARGIIRDNIEALSLTGTTKIFKREATKLGEIGTLQPFDLVFCDPPYGKNLAEPALAAAKDGGWLKNNALIVVEERKNTPLQLDASFRLTDERATGDSALRFFRFNAD